ncbi:hypothetical protein GN330_05975 [Nitratireductor sp. CAU 1489]|uniref:Uncharacterized protein n=1 Tax=Nitratireductor arenosus TaxID=2682096 RepID=A0A844QDT1_9HYPH|nr:hypothetical protein [Nitratireductor arenosus]MVA96794.1 hypothetical protein [Nitratireductor arenosus]
MQSFLRTLAVLLLAAFAAGNVANAAMKTEMSLGMSAVGVNGKVGVCQGCVGMDAAGMDVAGMNCDQACVQSLTALPAPQVMSMDGLAADIGRSIARVIVGRSGPPEPHPPR